MMGITMRCDERADTNPVKLRFLSLAEQGYKEISGGVCMLVSHLSAQNAEGWGTLLYVWFRSALGMGQANPLIACMNCRGPSLGILGFAEDSAASG